jgi:lysophospholipase L1-like esterase
MISLAVKMALSPLLVAQGLLARRRIPRLPEAAGARAGRVGRGSLLRLLVVGDSSAAGVGVADQRQALAAPLAARLAQLADAQVHWSLIAESGLTTAQVHERLRALPLATWDLAVVVSGVNDVVDQVPSHHAVAERDALANRLRNAHGVRHVAFAPLPPVHRFPGLPQPLRWVAGADARRHNDALRDWAASRDDVSFVAVDMTLDVSTMAEDGFHPGAPVYRHVSDAIARHLAARHGAANPH